MFEIIGLIFGGVTRLWQHHIDTKDKQAEREHELDMTKLQFGHEDEIRKQQMELLNAAVESRERIEMAEITAREHEIDTAAEANHLALTMVALHDQTLEAQAAGGVIAKLSASVRPVTTYAFSLVYLALTAFIWLFNHDATPITTQLMDAYHLVGSVTFSILGFWFADRSIGKNAGVIKT